MVCGAPFSTSDGHKSPQGLLVSRETSHYKVCWRQERQVTTRPANVTRDSASFLAAEPVSDSTRQGRLIPLCAQVCLLSGVLNLPLLSVEVFGDEHV
jgi:hypothetical protein